MIDRDALLAWPFEEKVQHYTERDTMLYALSLGFGEDPMDAAQLRHVIEPDLQAFPTMALVLAHPGPWTGDPATGIDRAKVVHGEQMLTVHAPLPAAGTLRSRNRVVDVLDKGVGKGAVIYTERELIDDATSQRIAIIEGATFCRGDGGFGGPSGPVREQPAAPEGPPDWELAYRTRTQAALLYRLNGDYNPLHSHPEAARRAGFERPIAHGLYTLGVCARLLASRAGRLRAIRVRFAKPLVPGETVVVRAWQRPDGEIAFSAWCREREVQVLSGGLARFDSEES